MGKAYVVHLQSLNVSLTAAKGRWKALRCPCPSSLTSFDISVVNGAVMDANRTSASSVPVANFYIPPGYLFACVGRIAPILMV